MTGGVVEQVILPERYRQSVLKAANDSVAGHTGVRKTYACVLFIFFDHG